LLEITAHGITGDGPDMTIGIAAICDSGRHVVTASDRMITRNYPSSIEFETAERKAELLHRTCLVLQSSNDMAIAGEIVDAARLKMAVAHQESIQALADLVKQAYVEIRLRLIDAEVILRCLGPDYARYRDKEFALPDYLKNQPVVYQTLVQRMEQYDFRVFLLVAGIDRSGAHLFQVNPPGVCQAADRLGYAAIGSGFIHALNWLSVSRQTRQTDLVTTLFDVYQAKRLSEVAPGVGEGTDLAITDEQGGAWFCTSQVLDELKSAYDVEAKRARPELGRLASTLEQERHRASGA